MNNEDLQETSSHRRCSVRKGLLRNFAKFTGKHLCQSLFFNKVAIFNKLSKNTFFTERLRATASEESKENEGIIHICLSYFLRLMDIDIFNSIHASKISDSCF